ncbi:MAG: hypothetical protein HY084_10675, partial [Gemmatimonadetes bacterium]|nr:hypothetical protein [Gemmatimonadota bacterium]
NALRDLLATRMDQALSRPTLGDAARATPSKPDAVDAATTGAARTPAAGASGVQAPAGTDPALWSILTNEERNFFARTASAGPLTYSKVMNLQKPGTSGAPPIRGRRLDIKG